MQSILELLSSIKIEQLISDIEHGNTCVLMKPRGVKVQVCSSPKFEVLNKSGKPINILDIISSDLYVTPYMLSHRFKSTVMSDESYELIHNYEKHVTYLSSIKIYGVYVNNYKMLHHRAALYDLEMPIIDGLSMDNLKGLIRDDSYFHKLKLSHVADAVMFLNSDYQATLVNPHREESKPATPTYNKLVHEIFKNKPVSLSENVDIRFLEILDWAKAVRKETNANLQYLRLPKHITTIQNFTLTFLPQQLIKFLKADKLNVVIFRMILMILSGKGYNKKTLSDESKASMKSLSHGLSWEI